MASFLLCLILSFVSIIAADNKKDDESSAVKWLTDTYDPGWAKRDFDQTTAGWDHTSNMDDVEANTRYIAESAKMDSFTASLALVAKEFLKSVKKFTDPSVERQLKMIVGEGISNDPEYTELVANTSDLNDNVQICAWDSGKQNCSTKWGLDGEIKPILLARSDYDKIKYIWDQLWIDGAKMKPLYEQLVKLGNKKANENGYKDYGDYKRSAYEDPNLPATLERMWTELLPLFEQIHTYYRRTLRKEFPGKMDDKFTIPSHFPTSWVQQWSKDPNLVYPYPKEAELNVSKLLLDNAYTSEKMYRKADDFVDSMGLKRMEKQFWENSLFTQPAGKKFDSCQGLVWKFGDDKNLKTRTCAKEPAKDWFDTNTMFLFAEFFTYVDAQPHNIYRRSSRSPFLDAFLHAFEMASKTGKRLRTVGVFNGKDVEGLKAYEMNELMRSAMDEIGIRGLSYASEFWRWHVFDGSSKSDSWDDDYNKLMLKYQGMEPADPKPKEALVTGADYEISHDKWTLLPAMVSRLLAFQFYEGLCNISNYKGPLHQCDFYGSKAAGDAIKEAFKLGSSKPPMEIIKIITGQKEMSAEPVMRYFKPLYDWLKGENDKANDCYGWGYDWPANVLKNLEKNRCAKK